MCAKILIITGLPGAGKTTYLNKLLYDRLIDCYYDDFQDKSYEKSPEPQHSRYFRSLIKDLRHHKTVAVADIRYCVPENIYDLRDAIRALVPSFEMEVRYFENNPVVCASNAEVRAAQEAGRDIVYERELIDHYSNLFQFIPASNGEVMRVYQENTSRY